MAWGTRSQISERSARVPGSRSCHLADHQLVNKNPKNVSGTKISGVKRLKAGRFQECRPRLETGCMLRFRAFCNCNCLHLRVGGWGALLGPSWAPFCSLFGPPVLGLASRPKSLFFLVLNPGPGPGVSKFPPTPSHLKNFLITFILIFYI